MTRSSCVSVNKSMLIDAVARKAEFTKSEVTRVVDCFFDEIESNLAMGNKIALTGLFTISRRVRPARMGFNPRNREKIRIAEKTVTCIKLGSTLKNPSKCCCK